MNSGLNPNLNQNIIVFPLPWTYVQFFVFKYFLEYPVNIMHLHMIVKFTVQFVFWPEFRFHEINPANKNQKSSKIILLWLSPIQSANRNYHSGYKTQNCNIKIWFWLHIVYTPIPVVALVGVKRVKKTLLKCYFDHVIYIFLYCHILCNSPCIASISMKKANNTNAVIYINNPDLSWNAISGFNVTIQ